VAAAGRAAAASITSLRITSKPGRTAVRPRHPTCACSARATTRTAGPARPRSAPTQRRQERRRPAAREESSQRLPFSAPGSAGLRPACDCSRRDAGAPGCTHKPHSFFTCRIPVTRFCSLGCAAQRAVWLRPQSGANTRRSAGACLRQRRTRSATFSGVSM